MEDLGYAGAGRGKEGRLAKGFWDDEEEWWSSGTGREVDVRVAGRQWRIQR